MPGVATGLALITVDAAGENMITVAPGANGECGPAEAHAALAGPPGLLVISAEIPSAAIAAALAGAARRGVPDPAEPGAGARGRGGGRAAGGRGRTGWWSTSPRRPRCSAVPVAGLAGAGGGGRGPAGPADRCGQPGCQGGRARRRRTAATRWSPPDRTALRWLARAAPSRCRVLRWPAWMPSGRVTRSWPRWRWAWPAGACAAEALRAACAAGATATTRRGTQTALPRPAGVLAATGVAGPWPAGD